MLEGFSFQTKSSPFIGIYRSISWACLPTCSGTYGPIRDRLSNVTVTDTSLGIYVAGSEWVRWLYVSGQKDMLQGTMLLVRHLRVHLSHCRSRIVCTFCRYYLGLLSWLKRNDPVNTDCCYLFLNGTSLLIASSLDGVRLRGYRAFYSFGNLSESTIRVINRKKKTREKGGDHGPEVSIHVPTRVQWKT